MAAGKRTSAAKKTAGIKGKRITVKQRVARVKNIAVARSHKKKGRRKSDKVNREFLSGLAWGPIKKSKKRRRVTDKSGIENMPWK